MSNDNPNLPARATGAGMTTTEGFDETSLVVAGETSSSAMAARVTALAQAKFIMAMKRTRNMDDVRQKMLRACERPGFAGDANEKVWGAAWYKKPVGDGVEGFSIRFAEEAIRALGNIDVQTVTLWDDERKRIVEVTVLDLENNISYPTSITLEKTVERNKLPAGTVAIRQRTNSYGKPVYIIPATDDEVFGKQQNLISKAIRNGALRLLPGDIQAECRTRIMQIRNGDAAKDPDGFKRKVLDAFATLNVMPPQLEEYLGHPLGNATPAELTDLRELYTAIKEGRTTWAEIMSEATDEPTTKEPQAPITTTAQATESLRARAEAAAKTPPPAPAADPRPPAPIAEVASTVEEAVGAPPKSKAKKAEDLDPTQSPLFKRAQARARGENPDAEPTEK